MKVGLFLWGLFWLLAGGLVSYLGCFTDEVCSYSSLIAPLPGVLFIYLSLRKLKSADDEKSVARASSFYLKASSFLFFVGVLVFVEINYFSEGLPLLAFSVLLTTLGVLWLRDVFQSIQTGNITFYREGVIGHGFHTQDPLYNSNNFCMRQGSVAVSN